MRTKGINGFKITCDIDLEVCSNSRMQFTWISKNTYQVTSSLRLYSCERHRFIYRRIVSVLRSTKYTIGNASVPNNLVYRPKQVREIEVDFQAFCKQAGFNPSSGEVKSVHSKITQTLRGIQYSMNNDGLDSEAAVQKHKGIWGSRLVEYIEQVVAEHKVAV